MSFAIIAIIIFLVLLFLFFVVLIIIGLTTNRGKSETKKSSVFSSLTSKFSTTNIGSILLILVVAVIIIAAIVLIPLQLYRSANYLEIRSAECFDNNETFKDYGYSRVNGGDFVIEKEKMMVLRTVRVTSHGLLYEYPDFKISIGGLEYRETITFNVLLESENGFCPFNFTVKGPSIGEKRVTFGVNENDRIWTKIDNSPITVGNYSFDTSGSYDLTVDITSNKVNDPKGPQFYPSFSLDRINFG